MSAELSRDFNMVEVAEALGMSERWVRQKIKDGAEHNRYGHKVRFTAEQVDRLRASCVRNPVKQGVTTGRKRS